MLKVNASSYIKYKNIIQLLSGHSSDSTRVYINKLFN